MKKWMYPLYAIAGKEAEYFKELAADVKERYEKAVAEKVSMQDLLKNIHPTQCPHCGAKKE